MKHHTDFFDSEKHVFLTTLGEVCRGKTLSCQEIKRNNSDRKIVSEVQIYLTLGLRLNSYSTKHM